MPETPVFIGISAKIKKCKILHVFDKILPFLNLYKIFCR